MWADPPFAVVQEIYRQARLAVASRGVRFRGFTTDSETLISQSALRQVLVEFNRRLVESGILVEGMIQEVSDASA
jgi:hypothetical protein